MIGDVFADRYRITAKLGTGGMADVYLADDEKLQREVALKVLHPQFATDENFVARFRHEAQAAAGLNHPNIVSIYDWGQEDSTYFIVMERVEGRDLKQIIQEDGPLPASMAVGIASQVANALTSAHQNHIVHRDIKPHNIVINPEGIAKVTDFGIARATASNITQTGSVMGTAQYISPEQAQGQEVGPATDIHSLGVVLHEMMTGEVPFNGGDSAVAIAMKHAYEAPPKPRSINPKVPRALESVILHAMAKHPERRYASAEELGTDLARFSKGRPVSAVPAVEQTMVPARAAAHARGAAAQPRRSAPAAPRQTRLWPWIIAALIALMILAAAGWAVVSFIAGNNVKVPALTGKTVAEARQELTKLGLKFAIDQVYDAKAPKGEVTKQQPEPGETLPKGSIVYLTVSRGVEMVKVPDVKGASLEDATFSLSQAGLRVGKVQEVYSDTVTSGNIVNQSPAASKQVPKDSAVRLWTSKGKNMVIVPAVTNMSESQAYSTLASRGLTMVRQWDFSSSVPKGKVIDQDPNAGEQVERGGSVTVVISKGKEMVGVPDVVGWNEATGKTKLENAGFSVEIEYVVDPPNAGKIVDQYPDGGKQAEKGSIVKVQVGKV